MSVRPCRVADDPTGLEPLLRSTLAEDIGRGDITTRLTVPAERMATATLLQKQQGVLAGAPVFEAAFAVFDPCVTIEWLADEGSSGDRRNVAVLRGPARSLLTAERTALNFIQRLSGIATQTRTVTETVAGTGVTILDTRKTTPGLRNVEKYACRVGGARNHRAGLDDGVLIKDNHLAAAGSITAAVTAAVRGAPSLVKIECEVTDLAGLEEAIQAGADIILLDNMTPDMVREAKRLTSGRAILEASGGITLANVRAYAEAGVDYISLGALTHSAQAIDFSLDFRLEEL
jgi:nicotinate-nucleotide pyrophosphorylase (carboxylating)